jgi:hypothetical protein
MALTPRLRKLALTAHVTSSVGWLGAVVAFLALSIASLASQDPQTVRGAYLVMELTGWVVLVSPEPGLAAHRAGLLTEQQLGSVPALLGPVQARDQRRRHDRLVALHADPRRPGRRCRSDSLVQ